MMCLPRALFGLPLGLRLRFLLRLLRLRRALLRLLPLVRLFGLCQQLCE